MFVLKKIMSSFLLPPGIFVLLLFVSSAWFLFRRKWSAVIVNLFICTLVWSLSAGPVSDALLAPLERGFPIPKSPHGDVIILLGGGVAEEAPEMSGIGAPSTEMVERIAVAVRLQRRLDTPVLISGGNWIEGRRPEAEIVKQYLISFGIPAGKIIKEDRSRDTFENAKYSSGLSKKKGYKRPILVTSAYHMKRSVEIFERVGMRVVPFPAGFRTWKGKQYNWMDYQPSASALYNSALALHEYIGLLFYKVFY